MNSKTATLALSNHKDKVFSYLSKIENLPKWATEFCSELKKIDGKYKVVCPMGELFFKIHADSKTGVIDMFAGPEEDKMGIFPLRVLSLPGGTSITLFTLFQTPDINDMQFEGQFNALLKELENIKRQVAQ